MKKENTFEPGTLIPRGMYIRKCETGLYNKQHFAKLADKERNLRLDMMKPSNWLSGFFAKEPDKEELQVFAGSLIAHLERTGYDTSELDDLFQRMFVD